MHATVSSLPAAQQSVMIVRRSHSRSPHLQKPVREIHSLRTGRYHGAPAGPRTCHARSRLTTKLSPGSFAKSPLQANRLLETAAFTNPTSQILPLAKQPDQTISKLDRSISKARPNHQQPDQTISNQTSPSATQPNHQQTRPNHQQTRPNHQQPDQTISNPTKLPTTRPNSSRPKNHPPARELPAGQRTTSRPSCPISGPCRR